MMRVLVGVDGSQRSLEAIRFVSRVLSADRDQVSFFFSPQQRRWTSYLSSTDEEQEAILSEFADSVFAQAAKQLPEDFANDHVLASRESDVSHALLNAARESPAQLIVVGTGRGSHRLPFSVGGVARTVIHESDRPVLACRQRQTDSPPGPLRVLLASDPSDPSDSVGNMVDLLHQFSWPDGSRGQLIHVMDYVEDERLRQWIQESPSSESVAWSDALDREVVEQRNRIQGHLSRLQKRLPTIFQNDDPILAVGHVVAQILETIDRGDFNLVVVGGRRRGPLARLLGSTTEGLLLQANASILVVHDSSV